MKFILANSIPKLKNEKIEEVTFLSYRSNITLEKAKYLHGYSDWFNNGTNHRQEGRDIVYEIKQEARVIEITDLEELINIRKENINENFESLIISYIDCIEIKNELLVYYS